MSGDKRSLLQEAMVLQTDEERKAFVESLSLEERQELYRQIAQIVNAAWDVLSVVFDRVRITIQAFIKNWSKISEDTLREIFEEV